ncbi:MAG: trypsin-like peptidase domain-containing protein [Candidatus Kapaibacterium sp.]|nr:trypsin-like peptidase domain-containing protein [Ignavibacteriota bacterium]MCB9220379.1 trypsin-like peptidase domain-containing protein [Ignavibacteria bacterium]
MKKQYIILFLSIVILFTISCESNAQSDISNSRQNAITKAIEKASPAIVGINVTEVRQVLYRNPYSGTLFERFFGRQRDRVREYEVKGLGSGFIISPDGYILTNNHVAGNAKKIVVTTTDGKRFDAEIIGTDPATDIALLKIKSDEKLPYIEFANSDDLIIGEWAIALGNPFGLFDINAKPTVTVGVISNKGVNFLEEQDNRLTVYKDMIQTDAAISSGNSGGPLVNAEGKAIGMNTMIFSTSKSQSGAGSIGIGFSIPINRVNHILELIKSKKNINRNIYLGLEIQEIDERVISYLNLPDIRGVVIYSTQNNGPANKAGLEPGDVILAINGRKVFREDDFYIEVYDSMVGESLEFQILRGDNEKTIKLQLEEPQQNRRYR